MMCRARSCMISYYSRLCQSMCVPQWSAGHGAGRPETRKQKRTQYPCAGSIHNSLAQALGVGCSFTDHPVVGVAPRGDLNEGSR